MANSVKVIRLFHLIRSLSTLGKLDNSRHTLLMTSAPKKCKATKTAKMKLKLSKIRVIDSKMHPTVLGFNLMTPMKSIHIIIKIHMRTKVASQIITVILCSNHTVVIKM